MSRNYCIDDDDIPVELVDKDGTERFFAMSSTGGFDLLNA